MYTLITHILPQSVIPSQGCGTSTTEIGTKDTVSYRPDIDGLRALAVALVLLFHAEFGFPGGFIGVDVFFVISGFLVTRSILGDLRADKFRMSDFWLRRMRRILPAAAFVNFIVLIAGYAFVPSVEYRALAKSTIAGQMMLSNVWFWWRVSYFNSAAELNPLLHTWSLAVEEQFYVVYPFILLFFFRLPCRQCVRAIATIAIISLVISECGVHQYPDASYYMLPSRAWELLLGGLVCFAPVNRLKDLQNSVLTNGGVLTIFIAALCFNSSVPFPGVAALVPCAGTAAIIYGRSSHLSAVGKLLSVKPVVYIGRMSYSLYLWHWPVLSFLKILFGHELDPSIRFTALAATSVLSILTWKYVETPFRTRRVFTQPRKLLMTSFGSLLVLICFSVTILLQGGFPKRFGATSAEYEAVRSSTLFVTQVSADDIRRGNLPVFGVAGEARKCMVWGDSHAMALIPGIDAACRRIGCQGYQATHSSTPPILDFVAIENFGLNARAPEFNRAAFDFAVENKVEIVFLAGVWSTYQKSAGFEKSLVRTVEELVGAGVRVAIVLDVAWQEYDAPLLLSSAAILGRDPDINMLRVPLSTHRRLNAPAEGTIRKLASNRVTIIDPADHMVDRHGFWPAVADGKLIYRDTHHLSFEGSLMLVPQFERVLGSVR